MNPIKPLNTKQQRFVKEYLIDLNATQAYIRAGYKASSADASGPRLLGDVRTQEAIRLAQQKRGVSMKLTQESVVAGIQASIARSIKGDRVLNAQGEQVQVQVDGEMVGLFKPHEGHVLKGFELLARHLGMLTDKLQVERRELEDMTTEEIQLRLDQVNKARKRVR